MTERVNQIGLCGIALLTYMIMSGFLTQTGVILQSVSESLQISVAEAGGLFSFLTGGTFAGTLVSMWLFKRYAIGQIFRAAYGILLMMLLATFIFNTSSTFWFSTVLGIIGVCCGVGLSGGAVIISSSISDAKYRASAFLATDCSFSVAGYIFPSLAAVFVASGYNWTIGYAMVGSMAILIMLASFILRFPATESAHCRADTNDFSDDNKNRLVNAPTAPQLSIWTPRVILMATALCLYLVSQTTFLTWAPQYLESQFLLDSKQAASAVSNYWGPSIFGLIAATLLVTKLPTRAFLLFVSGLAIAIVWLLYSSNSASTFLSITLLFGFATSCIFKIGITVGTLQIAHSPPVLVTFLLCSATLGSTIAPALSSAVVSQFGVQSAILLCAVGYTLVALLFGLCILLEAIAKKMARPHA